MFNGMRNGYARSLGWVLHHPGSMLALTLGTMVLSVYLYTIIPKGFFPQQDTGRISGYYSGCGGHFLCRHTPEIDRSAEYHQ